MSTGKLVWYHVATDEWRDAPPTDGTWAMEHIQGRSPFSRLPSHLDIIEKLDALRAELQRENHALKADKEILDWLEAHAISIKVPHGEGRFAIILPTREAIQQARKEGQS